MVHFANYWFSFPPSLSFAWETKMGWAGAMGSCSKNITVGIAGDIDGDGDVDVYDFCIFSGNYGKSS